MKRCAGFFLSRAAGLLALCLLCVCAAFAQAPSMEQLIANAATSPMHKQALLKALMQGQVYVIGEWTSPALKEINIQDFSRNGRPFTPFFSDQKHFADETRGSPFEKKGTFLDANIFASVLKGTETVILNPGSKTPIEFTAAEMKQYIDSARLLRLQKPPQQ